MVGTGVRKCMYQHTFSNPCPYHHFRPYPSMYRKIPFTSRSPVCLQSPNLDTKAVAVEKDFPEMVSLSSSERPKISVEWAQFETLEPVPECVSS